MARSFRRPAPATEAEEFTRSLEFSHRISERRHTVRAENGRYFIERYQTDPAGGKINAIEKELHFVLGSGNRAAYLAFAR